MNRVTVPTNLMKRPKINEGVISFKEKRSLMTIQVLAPKALVHIKHYHSCMVLLTYMVKHMCALSAWCKEDWRVKLSRKYISMVNDQTGSMDVIVLFIINWHFLVPNASLNGLRKSRYVDSYTSSVIINKTLVDFKFLFCQQGSRLRNIRVALLLFGESVNRNCL